MKNIKIPEKMKNLPLDKRGYPIPYIVLIDNNGVPHFKVNDDEKLRTAAKWKFCAICGTRMKNGDMWVIGGPGSAFHPAGHYFDTPTHHECGAYALQVCPYLALRNYDGKESTEKIAEKVVKEAGQIFVNHTVDPNRPIIFVYGQITGFHIQRPDAFSQFIRPYRPFVNLEFWRWTEKINSEVAIKEIMEHFYAANELRILQEEWDIMLKNYRQECYGKN